MSTKLDSLTLRSIAIIPEGKLYLHPTIGETPAMQARLVNHLWSIEDLVELLQEE